eukprot:jgi/Botrbrau1/9312/Bobra.0111s0036.1
MELRVFQASNVCYIGTRHRSCLNTLWKFRCHTSQITPFKARRTSKYDRRLCAGVFGGKDLSGHEVRGEGDRRPKAVVVGGGWAGLGAAWHLVKQGYAVDLLEAGPHPGGLVAGWTTQQGRSVELGIHGFWRAYYNIFELVKELGLRPFTDWTASNQYSPQGLEVEAPIFADKPRLPSPLGHFLYTDFKRLPVLDRLSALPLMAAAADFDNSAAAWKRYDGISARELFRRYGVSQRLYDDAFNPMLLVGLFAPGELCSAAACLGMLKFFILNHQADFDVVWCRGTTGATIFRPWVERIEAAGGTFRAGHRVSGLSQDPSTGCITSVTADTQQGPKVYQCDALVMAVGISGLQRIVAGCPVLAAREEFRRVNNLGSLDILAVRLWLDRKVDIPRASNACFGFDARVGWTFFHLNELHDEYADANTTIVEADFYHANELLPMSDEAIVQKVMRDLTTCVPGFRGALVVDSSVLRLARAVTHFAPGCYPSLMRPTTSFPNLFAAGDWIVDTHGSYSQEKAYVTGIEAANNVMRWCGVGSPAPVIPLELEEAQVVALRAAVRATRRIVEANPLNALLPVPLSF